MTFCHYRLEVRRKHTTLAAYLVAGKRTGKTQQWLADQLGVERSYISRLASGDRQPALDLALRISELTGVPVEALVSPEKASA